MDNQNAGFGLSQLPNESLRDQKEFRWIKTAWSEGCATLATKELRRCRNRDALLFARGRNVRHGRAPHVTRPAQVIVAFTAMHGAAVVPHHEVVQASAVRMDELPLRGVIDELMQQRLVLLVREVGTVQFFARVHDGVLGNQPAQAFFLSCRRPENLHP